MILSDMPTIEIIRAATIASIAAWLIFGLVEYQR
jgi:hypothetical protein